MADTDVRIPEGFERVDEPSNTRIPEGFERVDEPADVRIPEGFERVDEPAARTSPARAPSTQGKRGGRRDRRNRTDDTSSDGVSQADRLRATLPPSGAEQFAQGINAALADLLDAPGEATAALLRKFGVDVEAGAFRRGASGLGIAPTESEEPDTAAFAAGRMVGNNLPFILAAPAGALLRAAPSTATGVGAAVREGVRQGGRAAVAAPVTTAAVEVGASAAAGVAGFEAEKRFPNSPIVKVLAELGAGLTIAAGPIALGRVAGAVGGGALSVATGVPLLGRFIKSARDKVVATAQSVSPKGARTRATNRVSRALGDPDEALRNLDRGDTLPGAPLTTAQRTGDPGMLALERSVLDMTDDLRIQRDEQLAELNSFVRGAIEAPASAGESARQGIEASQDYLRTLLDGRLRTAARVADERIAALGAGADAQEAGRIVRTEIDNALADARLTENQLYAALDPDVQVLPNTASTALRSELRQRGRTGDPADIPDFVTEFLGTADEAGRLANGATFDELRVLRSRVLREIRDESSKTAPNRNKVRILDDVQEAILADLSAVDGGDDLRTALSFSRDLNDRFRRGAVGRLTGRERRGGPAVPAELTLTRTLGVQGPNAAQNARDILAAVRDGPDIARAAASDFIKGRFLAKAVRQDRVSPARAETFLIENKALLDEFPEVRSDLEQTIRRGEIRNFIERRNDRAGARLAKPSMSKAAMFIQRSPSDAFESIRAARNPGKEMTGLVKMAARDTTGEAAEGLQASFMDWALTRASTSATDASGQSFVSGTRLERLLSEPSVQEMAEKVLTKSQRERLGQAVETAKLLDKAVAANGSVEGILGDAPNKLIESMVRILTLRGARVVSGGFGDIQTPGIISNRARDLLQSRVKDPGRRLIIDAITSEDDALFRALLENASSVPKQAEVNRRINSWLAGVLFETGLPLQGLDAMPERDGSQADELRSLLDQNAARPEQGPPLEERPGPLRINIPPPPDLAEDLP